MKGSRAVLLIVSSVVVLVLLGGGLAFRAGAADNSFHQASRFEEVFEVVQQNYVDPVNGDSLLDGAYEGMLNGLDANGSYMTAEEVAAWSARDPEALADPGIEVLKSYGALQVVRVVPGSPAEEAGIKQGDQIRRLNGRSLRDVSLDQAIRLLHGKPGSSVTLGVLETREGIHREEITVRRVLRSDAPFQSEVRGDTLVLSMNDLARANRGELVEALKSGRTKGATRLLLDLRDVVEGTPREALPVLGLFVTGDVLRLRDKAGHVLETLASPASESAWSAPVAVLVNGTTAGGAEAVARVLQVRRKAPVYGESTYGVAAEPKLFKLSGGAGFLLPAYLWEIPSGETWENDGVKPDMVLTADGRTKEASAEQLRRALEEFQKAVAAAAAVPKAA